MTMDEIHEWHGYSSTDSLLPLCRYCNPRWEDKDEIALDPEYDIDPPIDGATAINYELAGREDASHRFRDLRSPSKARKRYRARNEKYWSWRGVKPGQVNRPHYTPNDSRGYWYITPLAEAPVSPMSKQQLYYEAQMYPRPPKTHHSRPWEMEPWGASNRSNGPKHARQRLEADLDDAKLFASWRYLVKHRTYGFDWTPTDFGEDAMYGMSFLEELTAIEADGCGCGCDTCHRECHEQQRLERETERTLLDLSDAGSDGDWEVLSAPSTAAVESEEDEEWELADGDTSSEDDDLVVIPTTMDAAVLSPPANPFTSGDDFDEDGYLPYTDAHFYSDISTSRCRACIAEHLTRTRLEYYAQARLSDFATLRGMPVAFTNSTWQSGVPFHQLLPYLVELDAGAEPAKASQIIRVARGPLAAEYYRSMEASWWNRRDCTANPVARVTDDLIWMLNVGCE